MRAWARRAVSQLACVVLVFAAVLLAPVPAMASHRRLARDAGGSSLARVSIPARSKVGIHRASSGRIGVVLIGLWAPAYGDSRRAPSRDVDDVPSAHSQHAFQTSPRGVAWGFHRRFTPDDTDSPPSTVTINPPPPPTVGSLNTPNQALVVHVSAITTSTMTSSNSSSTATLGRWRSGFGEASGIRAAGSGPQLPAAPLFVGPPSLTLPTASQGHQTMVSQAGSALVAELASGLVKVGLAVLAAALALGGAGLVWRIGLRRR